MEEEVKSDTKSDGLAKTQVHPYAGLFRVMSEQLTLEELEKMVFLSKDKLHLTDDEVLGWPDFFGKVQQAFGRDWDSMIQYLKNLALQFDRYINDGEDKLLDVIESYETQFCSDFERSQSYGIIRDQKFVGRTKEVEKVTEFFSPQPNSKHIKGVCICGMAGMGKTSMASEVCFTAQEVVIKRCLRGKKNLSDFYSEILRGLVEGTEDSVFYELKEEVQLKQAVHQKLKEITTDTILFLDNIDEISDSTLHSFQAAVQDLLSIQTEKVKLLMTTRQKLDTIENAYSESIFVKRYEGRLLEVELRSLPEEDAKTLLWSYAGRSKVTNEDCCQIVTRCGCCPLVIKIMGDHLSNPLYCSQDVLHSLELKDCGTEESSIKECLNQMFESLSSKCQIALIQLSVFQTSFDLKMAKSILNGKNAQQELFELVNRHLLEVEDISDNFEDEENFSFEDDLDLNIKATPKERKVKHSYSYCFHPIILGFLETRTRAYCEVLDNAKMSFIKYFLKQIRFKLGRDLDLQSSKAFAYIYDNSVHLIKFFELILKMNVVHFLQERGKNYVKTVYNLCKVCLLVGNQYEQLFFFNTLAEKCKEKQGEEMLLFYIRIKELAKHRMMQNTLNARTVLGQLKTMLPNIKEMSSTKEPLKDLSLAEFYGLTGRVAYDDARLQGNPLDQEKLLRKALENYAVALQYYQTLEDYVRSDKALITNYKGCVYYLLRDYQKSLEYHTKALEELKRSTKNSSHANIPNILMNIATVYLAMGSICPEDSEDAKQKFEKSLNFFKEAEDVDKKLGYPDETTKAGRLRNKADLYRRLNYYNDAARDSRASFRIFQNLFPPPHPDLTTSLYSMAYIEYCRGNYEKKKGKNWLTDEAEKAYKKAAGFYIHVRRMIETGGLPQTHAEYKYVKQNHLDVLQALKKWKYFHKVENFYRDFEAGKFDKQIREIQRAKEGHNSDSSSQSDSDTSVKEEEYVDYSEASDDDDDDDEQAVFNGSHMKAGGGDAEVGEHAEVGGGHVEVGGEGEVQGAVGGQVPIVGRHLSRLDSGIDDDLDDVLS